MPSQQVGARVGLGAWLLLGVLFALASLAACDRGSEPPNAAPIPTAAETQSRIKPPNILLYVVDTLRADALSPYGNPTVETSAIERVAREGTLFERAYAQSSWTRPSMASLLTATYPAVHGVQHLNDVLPEASLLLSEALAGHGYHTAVITSNPNIGTFFGFDQGVDDFIELYTRRSTGRVSVKELVTPADEVVDRALQWLETAREPFLLVVLSIDPHSPYSPPADFDRYGKNQDGRDKGRAPFLNRRDLTKADKQRIQSLYLGEVSFSDHEVGRLMNSLEERGQAEHTIVALTSDHGEQFWEHGERGHGKALWDESVHIPLILRYPPAVPAGNRVAEIVESIDLFPTLMTLAGLSIPDEIDGRDLFAPREQAESRAFSSLGLKGARLSSLRDGPWVFIMDQVAGRYSLFRSDLSAEEYRDVSGEHPERSEALAASLREHLSKSSERGRIQRAGAEPRQVTPEDLPLDQRQSLKALGYIDDEDDTTP